MKKLSPFKKNEHLSTDVQPSLQMSSINLCHGLVLKSHSVVEIQIKASFAIKMRTVDGL